MSTPLRKLAGRYRLRVRVMQALYAVRTGASPDEAFQELLDEDYRGARKGDQEKGLEEEEADAAFLTNLYRGVLAHTDEYAQHLQPHLQNWSLQRVAVVDQVLLMMALHELQRMPTVPVKVSLNEYLDIAKDYSTEQSSRFLNGVLHAVKEDLNQAGKIEKRGKGLLDD